MPNTPINIHIDDFSMGFNDSIRGHLLPLGSAEFITNFRLRTVFGGGKGALTPRLGFTNFTSDGAFTPDQISSIFQYIQADGTTFRIASAQDDIYNITGGAWGTSIFNNSGLDGEDVEYAVMNDLLIIANKSITTQKWTGSGSTSNLGGTPPANIEFVTTHRKRMFAAGNTTLRNRLYFSALDNVEDWTTTDDAGTVDIGVDDGDVITGIASMGPVLYIFKNHSVWGLWGDGPADHRPIQLSKRIGCHDHKTIAVGPAAVFFYGYEGVWAVNERGLYHLSTANALELGAKATHGSATVVDTEYWLCLDTILYVYEFEMEAWYRFLNHALHDMHTERDGVVMGAASDDSLVRTLNTGFQDAGSSITCVWRSTIATLGDFAREKLLDRIHVFMTTAASGTCTITVIPDGITSGASTYAVDMTDGKGTSGFVLQSQGFPQSDHGRLWQFQISYDTTSAGAPIFLGLGADFQVDERIE